MEQNFRFQIEPFEFDYEMDETRETGSLNRSGRDQTKWVQQSLNQILGLKLSTDGIMGAQTRSAIRSFQQKQGLTADGVVGARTAAAITAALSGSPTPTAPAKPATLRYVKGFSGPAAECTAALKRAGKTQAEALAIIDAQIAVAITLLRKAAKDLQRGSRSTATRNLFLKIFRVRPEFVPTWLKPTAAIKDRGDVVATRCARVADLLASGKIKFFCTINSTNCPDCGNDPSDFACSSWGDESASPGNSNVVCLGNAFWDDMKAGQTSSLLATLMHEPFHIYYGRYVTEHDPARGKFGGINCIVQFVFETNARIAPTRVSDRCANMAVRKELAGDEFEAEESELFTEPGSAGELSRFRRSSARSFSPRVNAPRGNVPRANMPRINAPRANVPRANMPRVNAPRPRPRPEPPHRRRYPFPNRARRTYLYAPESPLASEYVRWVQTMLNQALNLQLPVDGVMSVETRSAIRSLQEKNSLPVTGIVGPDTERALAASSDGQSTGADATPAPEPGTTAPAEPPSATEPELSELEWASEINRSSSDYIKWVQRSLNQIMGLRLAVDGIKGPMTNSAIRSFQQRQYGLKVDGIVGVNTEAALIRAGASAPPGSTGAPSASPGGSTPTPPLSVNTPLPVSGTGFYNYTSADKRYGTAATIRAVQAIATAWNQAHPSGPRLGIGNISRQGGGEFPPHSTHREGLNVDIRPVRSDRGESQVRYTDNLYSRSLTQGLVNLIYANPVLGVSSILFNDTGIQRVKPYKGHDDHLHVTFIAGAPAALPTPSPAPRDLPAAWSNGPVTPPAWRPKMVSYDSITCGSRGIPANLRPESVTQGWTARTQAIVNIIRGPLFGWKNVEGGASGTQTGHISGSYHYCGRAIDSFAPGVRYNTRATGTGLSASWRLANWAAHNAAALNVSEVIFYDHIWTVAKGGWRPYTNPDISKKPNDENALQHRDHVHISVY